MPNIKWDSDDVFLALEGHPPMTHEQVAAFLERNDAAIRKAAERAVRDTIQHMLSYEQTPLFRLRDSRGPKDPRFGCWFLGKDDHRLR